MTIKLALLLLFVICEFLAAIGVPSYPVNLVALGLFFLGLSMVI
jgi:hypothetical protein